MEEKATSTHTTGLIYGLNDRPPVREAIFAAIQPWHCSPQASLPSSNANALGVSEQDCYAFKEPAFLLSVPLFQPVCWEGSH